MSTQATAFVGFGVDLGDTLPKAFEAKRDEDGFFDFDQFVCEEAGVSAPPWRSPEFAAYRIEREKILAACPATICLYGVEDQQRYILYMNSSVIRADETPANVVLGPLGIDQVAAFEAFCEKYGIMGKPRWQMVAKYC